MLLIRAIPVVLKVFPDVKFVILGEGPEKHNLMREVDQLGITKNIVFKGSLLPKEVAQNLRYAQIYVSTSLTDGTSLSLFEAMACGTFPIVTNIIANREWISDEKNGFLVPINEPTKLAERIIQVLQNNFDRQSVIEKNYDLIKEYRIYETNMAQKEKIYNKLIGH